MSHIFISHAKRDGARYAKLLKKGLETGYKHGFVTWVDESDITSGDDWRATIDSAIETCYLMIVVVTQAALQSPYVSYEWAKAEGLGKTIIPILFANIPPDLQQHPLFDRQFFARSQPFNYKSRAAWDKLADSILSLTNKHMVPDEIVEIERVLKQHDETLWIAGLEALRSMSGTPVLEALRRTLESPYAKLAGLAALHLAQLSDYTDTAARDRLISVIRDEEDISVDNYKRNCSINYYNAQYVLFEILAEYTKRGDIAALDSLLVAVHQRIDFAIIIFSELSLLEAHHIEAREVQILQAVLMKPALREKNRKSRWSTALEHAAKIKLKRIALAAALQLIRFTYYNNSKPIGVLKDAILESPDDDTTIIEVNGKAVNRGDIIEHLGGYAERGTIYASYAMMEAFEHQKIRREEMQNHLLRVKDHLLRVKDMKTYAKAMQRMIITDLKLLSKGQGPVFFDADQRKAAISEYKDDTLRQDIIKILRHAKYQQDLRNSGTVSVFEALHPFASHYTVNRSCIEFIEVVAPRASETDKSLMVAAVQAMGKGGKGAFMYRGSKAYFEFILTKVVAEREENAGKRLHMAKVFGDISVYMLQHLSELTCQRIKSLRREKDAASAKSIKQSILLHLEALVAPEYCSPKYGNPKPRDMAKVYPYYALIRDATKEAIKSIKKMRT
jgi:hypothetical protein